MREDLVFLWDMNLFESILLLGVSGLNFKGCFEKRTIGQFSGIPINMIDLMNLKTNKKSTSRLKDLNDLENLPL